MTLSGGALDTGGRTPDNFFVAEPSRRGIGRYGCLASADPAWIAMMNSPRAWRLGLLAVVVVPACLFVSHALHYFFLFDDFALVGESATSSIHQIVGTALFGYYRPLVFLLVKLEGLVFGWSVPGGYALASLFLHCINATLLAVLASLLRFGKRAAAFAGMIFFLAPWSAEAVFWVSGQFDLVSTLGVLTALITATALARVRSAWDTAWLLTLGALGCSVAVFAKETAVVLPVLLIVATAGCDWRALLRRASLAYLSIVVAVVLAYLSIRVHVMPRGAGTPEDLTKTLCHSDLLGNLVGYLRALVLPPHPATGGGLGQAVHGFLAIAFVTVILPGAMLLAVRGRLVLTSLTVVGFLVSTAPVLFVTWSCPGFVDSQQLSAKGWGWYLLS